jgi:hypothetical protein
MQGDAPLSPVGRATRAQRQKVAAETENPHEKTTWLAAVKKEKVDLNTDTSQEEASSKRQLESHNVYPALEEEPAKNKEPRNH